MEARSIFAAVIHDVYKDSFSQTGRLNKNYSSALIVEASQFLAAHMAGAGHSPQLESFSEGGRTFVVFREPAETVSKYTPGDIINIKAAWTPNGLRLCL